MGKYLKYTGAPNTAFRDNDGTEWSGPGAVAEVTAERAKELMEQFPETFTEATKEEADKEATEVVSQPIVKPEGEVRYVDPETGKESLTPIVRDAGEVKE